MTEYTGKVHVGGPVGTHELSHLIISKVAVGPMDNNAFLLRSRDTDHQVLIDAANDTRTLLRLIGEDGLDRVITTHRHQDHWQSLGDVVSATDAITVAGTYDAEGIPVKTAEPVEDGDTITVGHCNLTVIHLNGHTPGSVALLYDDPTGPPHLFTGDSLFPGGPGKTTGGDDFDSLMHDLQTKVFDRLPDETWVYPGHGNDTTLGTERPSIPAWLARRW
jgi:glyoxylase-like metal-dependent hydrolase (beta-lactamase superfamily II)